MDDDGFKSVQFSLPAMPRILVDVWKFKEVYYREHFLDLLENGLDTLDRVETTSALQKAREKAKALKAKAEAEKAKAEEQQARNPAYYYDFTYDNDIYPEEPAVTPVKARRRSARLSSRWSDYDYSCGEKCEA